MANAMPFGYFCPHCGFFCADRSAEEHLTLLLKPTKAIAAPI